MQLNSWGPPMKTLLILLILALSASPRAEEAEFKAKFKAANPSFKAAPQEPAPSLPPLREKVYRPLKVLSWDQYQKMKPKDRESYMSKADGEIATLKLQMASMSVQPKDVGSRENQTACIN